VVIFEPTDIGAPLFFVWLYVVVVVID